MNVQDPDSIKTVAKQLIEEYPDLNVLFYNAGIMLPDNAADVMDEDVGFDCLDKLAWANPYDVCVNRAFKVQRRSGYHQHDFDTWIRAASDDRWIFGDESSTPFLHACLRHFGKSTGNGSTRGSNGSDGSQQSVRDSAYAIY